MNFGITRVSIAPLRSEAAHQSEMTSQLLFGETFSVLSKKNEWLFVSCTNDQHEGWVQQKQILSVNEQSFQRLQNQKKTLSFDLVSPAISNQEHIPVILGSTLPDFDGLSFQFNNKKIIYNGQVLSPDRENPELTFLDKIAYKFLNAPYLWGGRSPFGIDASGFVQVVFQLCGILLPRTIHEQKAVGKTIHLLAESKPGDIVFFNNKNKDLVHTGILLSSQQIIHCDEKVKISAIDSHGIFNKEQKQYSHQLRIIQRVV